MSRHSDDRLVAYLDGEIEGQDRQEIEAWLDSDPSARERLAALAQSTELVRQAYDEVMREPLPDRLIAAARGETAEPLPGSVLAFSPRRDSSAARLPVAAPDCPADRRLVLGLPGRRRGGLSRRG